MSSILEMLTQQLSGNVMKEISKQIGADEGSTQNAIAGALPLLLGGLAHNAAKGEGAGALAGALDRDHDGGILENVSQMLGSADTGNGILKHILGGSRPAIEAGLGKSTGLDMNSIGKLLPILAPVVMGVLGKQKRQTGMDANGLASMLSSERSRVQSKLPKQMSALDSLLDSDGDGDIDLTDIAKGGMSILGKILGG
jgi:hypothetical protein